MQRLTSMYVHRFSGTSVSGVSELSMCRTYVRTYMCVQMCGIVHAQILHARGYEICLLQMPIGQAKVYLICPSEMYSAVCIQRPYVLCTTGTIPWCRRPTCMYVCCNEPGYISLFCTGCCKVWIRICVRIRHVYCIHVYICVPTVLNRSILKMC